MVKMGTPPRLQILRSDTYQLTKALIQVQTGGELTKSSLRRAKFIDNALNLPESQRELYMTPAAGLRAV